MAAAIHDPDLAETAASWRKSRSTYQVCQWLSDAGFDQVVGFFQDYDIDGEELEAADDGLLVSMGIEDPELRSSILAAIPTATPAVSKGRDLLPAKAKHEMLLSDLHDANMAGFLAKEGGSNGRWRQRYCVLSEMVLFYFSNPTDQSKAKGSVVIAGATVGKVDRDGLDPGTTFYVARRNMKTYWLTASSEEEVDFWLAALVDHGLCLRSDTMPELSSVDIANEKKKKKTAKSRWKRFKTSVRKLTLKPSDAAVASAQAQEGGEGETEETPADPAEVEPAPSGSGPPPPPPMPGSTDGTSQGGRKFGKRSKKPPPVPNQQSPGGADGGGASESSGAPPPPPPPPPSSGSGSGGNPPPPAKKKGKSAPPGGGAGRGSLLSSIQNHNGVGGLRRVDPAEQRISGGPGGSSSGGAGGGGGGGGMASALSAAINSRRAVVVVDSDDEEWGESGSDSW